ncbi:hypothetical protein, partial [Streptomyces sp. SID12501]
MRGPDDAWSTALGTARLRGPDGTWTTVTADPDDVVRVTDNKDRRYYQSAVDVTDLVAAQGAGTWELADAAVSQTRTDREPTYYAGWSLVVVHGTVGADTAAGRSAVTVHQCGSWVGTSSTAPAFLFTG